MVQAGHGKTVRWARVTPQRVLGFALLIALALGTAPVGAASGSGAAAGLAPAQTHYSCDGKPATIVGTAAGDVIAGTPFDDVIVALGGNDVIDGLAGNDLICAGGGIDIVHGNDGHDRILGEDDRDYLFGDAGNDYLVGGNGVDYLNGGPHTSGDRCDGGAPAFGDVAVACEGVINVP